MLDKNDIVILWEMFVENNHILKREIRDGVHSLIQGTEARILEAMGSMMDVQIAPRLGEHDEEILTMKRHLKLA